MKKNILFLCGGISQEHEISLISCKCVLNALDRNLFHPIVVGISKQGVWHLEDEKQFFLGPLRADKIRLNETTPTVALNPFSAANGKGRLQASDGLSLEFDAVFPMLHGTQGEDGTIQGLLEVVGVPYVGANWGSSWLCMDKVMTKVLCGRAGIPVTPFVWLDGPNELAIKGPEIEKLGYPVFVKPASQGSSVGVTKVTSSDGLAKAVGYASQYDRKILIEKGISGRELECAVLGLNASPRASLVGEIKPSAKIGWYSYDAKYLLDDGAETLVPAPLDDSMMKRIQEFAIRVFHSLECDGMARIDMFLENGTGELYLNEANTIPGFTPISMYPKMWEASGLSYSGLITELIRLAFLRKGRPLQK